MSESATTDVFECPQCGRKGKWSPTIAGRKVKCKCGTTFTAPTSMDAPAAPAAEAEKPQKQSKPAPAPVKKTETPSKPPSSAAPASNSKVKPAPTYLASAPRTEGGSETKDSRLEVRADKIDKSAPPVVRKIAKKKADNDDDLYELAPAHDPPKNFRPAPPAGEGGEAAPETPGPPSAFGTAIKPRKKYTDEPPENKAKNLTFPLMLIGAAIILNFMYGAALQTADLPTGGVVKEVFLRFFISSAVLVAGMLVCANVLKMDFGPRGPAVFKTVSIAVSPMAVFGFATVICCTLKVPAVMLGYVDAGMMQLAIDAGLSLLLYVGLFGYMLGVPKTKIPVILILWALHVGVADMLIRMIAQPPMPTS